MAFFDTIRRSNEPVTPINGMQTPEMQTVGNTAVPAPQQQPTPEQIADMNSRMWRPNVYTAPEDIIPQPTASPAMPPGSTPQGAPGQWGGWNAQNVFENWDLNPLSQQTGVARDTLATQRDDFLRPIESSYRSAVGHPLDATSQNLYNDPGFQNFARTGQVQQPGGQSLASLSGGVGPASQQYASGSAVAPWTGQFNAPTAEQAIQTPGLQYALDRAKQAIERSAAAKGTLLTGGTLRDLSENQIGMALQGYGQAYNRARGEYDLSKSTFYEQQDRPFEKYYKLGELGRPV